MTEGTRIAIRDCQALALHQTIYKMSVALSRGDFGAYFDLVDGEFEEENARLIEVAFDDVNGTKEGLDTERYNDGLREFLLRSAKTA